MASDTEPPSALLWLPGLVTLTAPLGTVQVNVWLVVCVESEAETVTEYGLPPVAVLEIVPEIRPLVELIAKPGGSPVAE